MAIKPCDRCLKQSCDYSQYCISLLVVIILQTEVYKWPQFGTNGSICCCYARNVRRVQSFDCNIWLWYIVEYCNNIELLPSRTRVSPPAFTLRCTSVSASSRRQECSHEEASSEFVSLPSPPPSLSVPRHLPASRNLAPVWTASYPPAASWLMFAQRENIWATRRRVLSIFPLLHCTHIWKSWRSEWLGGLKGGICGKDRREEMWKERKRRHWGGGERGR